MIYTPIVKATFLSRPNRFVAHAVVEGETVVCHVKNTGRCRELLLPGATIYLQDFGADHGARKTRYDLIAVEKESRVINMDSQAPNKVFGEWASEGNFVPGLTLLRPETTWGSSRFDFYYEAEGGRRGFVEVKGVTLEVDGMAAFPDAPTQRGIKHLEELSCAVQEGYSAHVCFVIQMTGLKGFCPNERTHPAFGAALRAAAASGVEVLARDCVVTPRSLRIGAPVPVNLTCCL